MNALHCDIIQIGANSLKLILNFHTLLNTLYPGQGYKVDTGNHNKPVVKKIMS